MKDRAPAIAEYLYENRLRLWRDTVTEVARLWPAASVEEFKRAENIYCEIIYDEMAEAQAERELLHRRRLAAGRGPALLMTTMAELMAMRRDHLGEGR